MPARNFIDKREGNVSLIFAISGVAACRDVFAGTDTK